MTAGPVAYSHKNMNGLKIVNQADGVDPNDSVNKGQLDAVRTFAISRANHTGTQAASTISDFDTQVRTSRLDQMSAPTTAVNYNSQRISSVADPSANQDAATKNYVDNQISGLSSGLAFKGTVRAAVTSNTNQASPGTTLDGLTAATGDVFLFTNQTTGSQNGPWVWNGASAAMTRPANFDTTAEAVLGSFWVVREGSRADQFAIMSNDTAVTLGTTALTFVFVVPGGSVGPQGFTSTIASVSAGGSLAITHNLNSRYVLVQVARVGSPYDLVEVRIERTTANSVTVLPDLAMSAGEFEIMVYKVA